LVAGYLWAIFASMDDWTVYAVAGAALSISAALLIFLLLL
jgi:hypothetical protein